MEEVFNPEVKTRIVNSLHSEFPLINHVEIRRILDRTNWDLKITPYVLNKLEKKLKEAKEMSEEEQNAKNAGDHSARDQTNKMKEFEKTKNISMTKQNKDEKNLKKRNDQKNPPKKGTDTGLGESLEMDKIYSRTEKDRDFAEEKLHNNEWKSMGMFNVFDKCKMEENSVEKIYGIENLITGMNKWQKQCLMDRLLPPKKMNKQFGGVGGKSQMESKQEEEQKKKPVKKLLRDLISQPSSSLKPKGPKNKPDPDDTLETNNNVISKERTKSTIGTRNHDSKLSPLKKTEPKEIKKKMKTVSGEPITKVDTQVSSHPEQFEKKEKVKKSVKKEIKTVSLEALKRFIEPKSLFPPVDKVRAKENEQQAVNIQSGDQTKNTRGDSFDTEFVERAEKNVRSDFIKRLIQHTKGNVTDVSSLNLTENKAKLAKLKEAEKHLQEKIEEKKFKRSKIKGDEIRSSNIESEGVRKILEKNESASALLNRLNTALDPSKVKEKKVEEETQFTITVTANSRSAKKVEEYLENKIGKLTKDAQSKIKHVKMEKT